MSIRVVIGAINKILAYQICIPYNKEKEVLVSTVLGALFNLIANSLLVPHFGTEGAAVSTLGAEIVVFIVLTVYANRVFETKILYKRVPIYLASAIWFFGMRYLVDLFLANIILQLLITVTSCMVGYFIILLFGEGSMLIKCSGWNFIKDKK